MSTIFTPNTVIASADVNLNFSDLKTKTDYLTAPDSDWVNFTYTGTWVDYGGGYNPGSYRKDALGYVHLRGLVKSGTDGTSITTLPTGYRPEYRHLFVVESNDLAGRLDVLTDGTVIPQAATTNPAWVSLDGITFKAYA